MKKIFVFLLIVFSQPAHACLNEYHSRLNGELEITEDFPVPHLRFDDKAVLAKALAEADTAYRLSGRIEEYSDYAVLLVYSGRYEEAKRIFISIEKRTPGLATNAANLGTVYELTGENDSALYWICKAVEIDANEHEGSEWIHVKILEAKVALDKNKNYLETHSVLGLDFGMEAIPENKANLDLEKMREQIFYQLKERMTFIKPKDRIVGELLFDLGNVSALYGDNVKSGLNFYYEAKRYGFESELMEKRIDKMEGLQLKADLLNSTGLHGQSLKVVFVVACGFALSIVFLVLGLTFGWIKRRRKRENGGRSSEC